MYVQSGLGASENLDTNVYDASGNVVAGDATTTWGATSGGTYPLNPNPSLTQWLNQNSTYLCIGVVATLGLLMLGKAGR